MRRALWITLAALVAVACGWFLWDWWPDVGYFLSPPAPVALGDPSAFHPDRARVNRLVRVSGPLVGAVGGLEDTVEDFDGWRRGTGCKFREYAPQSLLLAVRRAAGPLPGAALEGAVPEGVQPFSHPFAPHRTTSSLLQ